MPQHADYLQQLLEEPIKHHASEKNGTAPAQPKYRALNKAENTFQDNRAATILKNYKNTYFPAKKPHLGI